MLKAMPGPTAYQPNVSHRWMSIYQEIPIPGIFILANARLHNRSAPQPRKTLLHKMASFRRTRRAGQTRLRVRVHALSVTVYRDLQPSALQIRHAINFVLLKKPGGQG